jgi:lipoteichoic acid synthase
MGNTVDAEFIVNSSLYAPSDQASSVKYANRVIPAMPRVLAGAGYDTFTMHANKVSYWNRGQLYQALGFTHYYDRAFFKNIPRMGQFGASDVDMFAKAANVVKAEDAKAAPFYGQFITLSSHGPFDSIPESRRPVRTPKELSGSLMGRYISAESYSDYALGRFFKALKSNGAYSNSIIIIYGDHTAMPGNALAGKNSLGARRLLGRPYRPADRQRIPLIIHLPGQSAPVLRREVAGQVDIMPTVTDLVGIDTSTVPHMGRSLFVKSSSLVPLNAYYRSHSFLNNRVLYTPKSGSAPALAYWIANSVRTGPTGLETTDLRRTNDLRKISDTWIMSRAKFNAGPKGWIPDPIARKAAKPYGFLQH